MPVTNEQPRPKTQAPVKPPAPPAEVLVAEKPQGWRPMKEAPHTGIKLYLLEIGGDGQRRHHEMYWYTTRQYRKGTWQETGWWRPVFGPNSPPKFIPAGWRHVSEGIA